MKSGVKRVFAFGFGYDLTTGASFDEQVSKAWYNLDFPRLNGVVPHVTAEMRNNNTTFFYQLRWNTGAELGGHFLVESMLLARTPVEFLEAEMKKVQEFLDKCI